jgi:transcriptional regulator with XRE-family HTH domain
MSILSMDIYTVFGLNMRRLRLPTGLSQEAAADVMKLGRSHVGNIERGQANITLGTFDAVANTLGCEWAELLDVQAARAFAASTTTRAPRIKPSPKRKRRRRRGPHNPG